MSSGIRESDPQNRDAAYSTVTTGTASALSDEFKTRAREQWGENPCGAHVANEIEFGTREYFEAIAHFRYRVYAPWMIDAIGFDRYRGKQLLEIGCGTGTDLLQFARGGAVVTGIDLTPRSIEITQKRFDVEGLSGDFAVGDAESLSFPDDSFDVAYSFGVLHHTPHTARAIGEMHRVLRPGGRAIVMLYHRNSLKYWGGVVLMKGVIGRELLRHDTSELLSRYVEYSETGGRPLVKVYTRSSARRLFGDFTRSDVAVYHLNRSSLGTLGKLLPDAALDRLATTVGWNLLITATK